MRGASLPIRQHPRTPTARRGALVATVAALLLGACGAQAPATLSTGVVAHAIATAIVRQSGITTRVSCPAHPPEQSGFRFSCVAHLAVGAYTVAVLETDGHGAVRFIGAGPLRALDSAGIERAIRRAMGRGRRAAVTVHCPSPVLQRSGLRFTCAAHRRSGAILHFTVHEDDGNGRVTLVSA